MKKALIIMIAVTIWAAYAHGGSYGCSARQTVALEVIEVVEVSQDFLLEMPAADLEDQPAADGAGSASAPDAISPYVFGGKVTVTSQPEQAVEVSVEAATAPGEYPAAAVRVTLTDP